MNEIKTFDDACKKLSITNNLPDVSLLHENQRKAINWSNFDENKYYPWFDMVTYKKDLPGVGFSYDDYYYGYACTGVGSRLCYKTAELAKYAGKNFTQLYKDYYVID